MREKILAILEKNARIDLKDLAVLLGESEAAVSNAIADMEKEHIICGYHTLINWDNTSEEKVMALIEVKVTPQRGMGFDKIAEKEVALFVSSKLSTLDSVLSTATHFVLKKYKDHGTALVEEVQDERMLVTP